MVSNLTKEDSRRVLVRSELQRGIQEAQRQLVGELFHNCTDGDHDGAAAISDTAKRLCEGIEWNTRLLKALSAPVIPA